MTYTTKPIEYGTYQWLRREIGGYLGFGYSDATWSFDQAKKVDSIIQSGYMQMLYPPAIPVDGQEGISHQWSFLTPVSRLNIKSGIKSYTLPTDFASLASDFISE